MSPLVSVLVPAFNHEAYVEQAIRSIWAQTYRPLEIIVVDDNSKDETFKVAKGLSESSPVPMKAFRHQNNRGCGAALQSALAHAKGDWIATLASDDFYSRDKIESQLNLAAVLGPSFGCIHSDAYTVDHSGTVLGTVYQRSRHPPLEGAGQRAFAIGRARVVAITAIVYAKTLQAAGGFREFAAEDFDLHLRISARTRYGFVNRPLAYCRQLDNSLGRNPSRFIDSVFASIEDQRATLGDIYNEALLSADAAAAAAFLSAAQPRTALRYIRQWSTRPASPRERLRQSHNIVRSVGLASLSYAKRRLVGRRT